MLKTIKKLFNPSKKSTSSTDASTVSRIPASEHTINSRDISRNAIKVIEDLQAQGYEAYLVGGGVRDLLLGGRPKDFDVATDATPEQIQRVFRKAHIIGRRFRIVHVRMGREVLEVTTFRGSHDKQSTNTSSSKKQQSIQNDKGMLLRDNVYGDLASDAYRRDFTINALYYDPSTEEIIDYCNGLEHLKAQELHIIGQAEARYKEDPVRMLRAIRFMCKLGFTLDEATEKPIKEHSGYLNDIPSARLFEEVLKLFMSGAASKVLNQLHHYQLLQYLFPGAARILDSEEASFRRLLIMAAENTDKRIAQGKRVTPAFIYAAFLWPSLQIEITKSRETSRASEQELMFKAAGIVISQQLERTSIPKRFLIPMREIWSLQLRFPKRDAKRAFSLLEHPKFRAAYDFLLLREQSGETIIPQLGEWWTTFQDVDKDKQLAMLNDIKGKQGRNNNRSRRRPKKQKAE